MKSNPLVLSLLGMLSLYGCTLPDPLDLREKCSDEQHGLTAVVYNRTVCHAEDVTGELKEVCGKFADAFAYGHCPPDAPICIRDEEKGTFTCSLSKCAIGFHEHDAKCERNTLLHCGGHGVECEKVLGWLDGRCDSDELVGVKCAATACEDGYKLDEENEVCIAVIECGEDEHIANGECEPDSVQHCGRHKAACSQMIKGWADGQCIQGVCVPSACEDGYKLDKDEDGSYCVPSVECLAGEHIYVTTVEVCETNTTGEEECVTETVNCEADTVSNCGHHGNSCTSIDGWMDGNCVEGRCHATACFEGYDLNKETMSCRFKRCDAATEYLHDNKCWKNSLEHCGSYSTDCTASPGWLSGECRYDESKKGVICVADACDTGYDLKEGQCVAKISCEDPDKQYYYNGNCFNHDDQNCGKAGYACNATNITGWNAGYCNKDNGTCIATACETGYDLKDGKCEAKTSCPDNQYYHMGNCLDNNDLNCGKHEYACNATNIAGWKDGSCNKNEGKCVATECETGYDLKDGKCEARISCTDPNTHYYNGECMDNDMDNCGKHNHKCASITGWLEGTCTNGVCVPSECQIGYHLNEGSCVADDSGNCGSVGNVCGQGQVCTQGACSDNCGSAEVRCEEGGVVSCADPNTSTTFCGANESCSTYITCDLGQACVGGKCKQNSCTEDNETLCVVNGENVCINVSRDDPNHCGACNLKCSDRPMANASSTTCVNGQCQYECVTGYTNCGTLTVPNCINTANFQNDPNNCGSCGKRCNSDELCSNGTCKKSTCTNQCLSNGTCVNTNDKCGTQCINCNSANNAASGICNAGTCTITSCMTGFHLTTAKTCALNTPTACGSTNSANVSNCMDKSRTHATDAYCNANGQCVAISCETGYHVVKGECVTDSLTACGASATDCTKLLGWKSGKCENGQCKASVCQSNYCLNATTCVDGAYNARMCGITGNTCTSCNIDSGQSCVHGTCVQSSCAAHVCFYQGTTCSNTAEHCGRNCVNCNTANNASAGTCNSSTGTCSITTCAKGYHKSGTSCVANTNTSCAPPNSSVAVNCMTNGNAASGVCDPEGQCVIITCASGYTLSDGKCVSSGGGSACTDHYTTIMLDGSSVRAYCIETLEDFKAVYTGTVTSATGAYILMDNFNLNNVTSSAWRPIFGAGFNNGIFYGNSKTLSGTLTCSSADCGLFGPLTNAKILNLNLNVSFNGGSGLDFGAVSRSASKSTLKNITSRGTLTSSGGVGGIVGSVSNNTTVSNCHVTGNIRAVVGDAGGIANSVSSSTIENCSFGGDIRSEDYYTGGLVGTLNGSSIIQSSFVSERAQIMMDSCSGAGGLVGKVSGKDNRISMSYCAGSVIGSGDSRSSLGGLVGAVSGGGLTIEKSVVFGDINFSGGSDVVVGGLIGSIVTENNVTIQSSASVGDIEAPSSTVAGIAHMTKGTLTVHDLYHLGKINGLRTSYDDFVHGGGEIVSNHYLSWVKLQQYIEHDSISTAGNELLARNSGEKLVTDLNQYTKSNFGEESWTTYLCAITTGPAGGEVIKYNLPLPRRLPKPAFCE